SPSSPPLLDPEPLPPVWPLVVPPFPFPLPLPFWATAVPAPNATPMRPISASFQVVRRIRRASPCVCRGRDLFVCRGQLLRNPLRFRRLIPPSVRLAHYNTR